MNAYSISKLADDACVSVHVVRDYMIRGLLHPARRTEVAITFSMTKHSEGCGFSAQPSSPELGSTNWRDFAKHWTQTIAKAWTDASSACDGRSTCVEQF